MISTDGSIPAGLLVPLGAELFNCFEPIDEDDIYESVEDKPIEKTTLFDVTGYGSDTFEKPDPSKKKTKPATAALGTRFQRKRPRRHDVSLPLSLP